jgi:O-antigen/teichoic acid export membrane protein
MAPKFITCLFKKVPNSINLENLKLLKGIFSMISASIINNLSKVAIIMIITRSYSKEEFGLWATITSVIGVLATGGDLGMVNALRNKLSEFYAQGTESMKEAKSYFFTCLVLCIILALILSMLTLIFYHTVPYESLFNTDNLYLKTQGKSILFWVQFLIISGIPLSIGNAAFFSFNESKLSAFFNVFQAVVTLLFIVIGSFFHFNIVLLSIGYFTLILITNLLSLLYFIYLRKWYFIDNDDFKYKSFILRGKYFLANGIKFLGLQFSKGFLENAGTVILSSTFSLGIAAEFNIVQKLFTLATSVYQSLFNPLWGSFAINAAKKNWKWCKKVFISSMVITSLVIPLFTLVLYFFGDFLLLFIGGSGFILDRTLIVILGISTYFYMLYTSVTTFQSAINKINLITLTMIFYSFLILPFTKQFLLPYGLYGVALELLFIWVSAFIIGGIQSYRIISINIKNCNFN